jgi:hypothetical protein
MSPPPSHWNGYLRVDDGQASDHAVDAIELQARHAQACQRPVTLHASEDFHIGRRE